MILKKILYCTSIALSIFLGACSDTPKPASEVIQIPELTTLELTASEKVANDKANDASLKMFGILAENSAAVINNESGNLSFSPLSLSMALSMIANSADGCGQIISDIYGFENIIELNNMNNKLMRYESTERGGTQTKLANSVWFASKYQLKPEYTELLNNMYYAEVTPVDFADATTLDVINSWAGLKTDGMITDALDIIDPLTDAILINAMYFDGKWAKPFDPKMTFSDTFHGTKGDSETTMMYDVRDIFYSENDRYSIGVLDFTGSVKLTIVVPLQTSTFEAAAELKPEDLRITGDAPETRYIIIPKFSDNQKLDLRQLMAALGIPAQLNLTKMGINKAAPS